MDVKNKDSLYVNTLLEKSRMNRDIATLAFKNSIALYFIFVFLAILGLTQNYIDKKYFFTLVFMGLGSLLIGVIPYVVTMIGERKKLNVVLFNLMLKDASLKDYYDDKRYYMTKRNEKNAKEI
ncbi:hypothetical protein JXM83_01010 [Candidatus Woesearchaeota archaeon]|nr:hypothetical protein [Candidatus Woesearchaeota archaeon]